EMLNPLLRIVIFICCIGSFSDVGAQFCEWLNTIERTISQRVHTDDSNNVIIAGRIGDTITYNNVTLTKGTFNNLFIIKYTSAGNVIWVVQNYGIASAGVNTCNYTDIANDNSGNYYLTGWAIGSLDFGNGVVLNSSNNQRKLFILKINNNGVAQWVRTLYGGGSYNLSAITCDRNNDVYFSVGFSGTVYYSGSTTPLVSAGTMNKYDVALLKYTNSGTLIWGRNYGGNGDQDIHMSLETDNFNMVYLSGINSDNWTFGSHTLSDTGLMLLKFDPNGDPILGKSFPGALTCMGSIYPDGRVVVSGVFKDSIRLGTNHLLRQTGTGNDNNYIAVFDTAFNCLWAIKDYPVGSAELNFISPPAVKNNSIYLGGYVFYNTTVLGGLPLNIGAFTQGAAIMVKIDSLGNVLWGFNNGCVSCYFATYSVAADNNGDAYFTGYWSDTVAIFNRIATSSWAGLNSFTAKIIDYSIDRGYVKSGPYCSGDSIKIPYTKKGDYYSGNEFIAQLSDSAGNFETNFRELGRVQDSLSGEIAGILPLFNVATSGKYRIRVISTNPIVQSYYLKDTLRLLIYSKDTANAGEDITICAGQGARLHTTGGSKWQWSPTAYFVDPKDSAKVSGIIAPDTSTEYRIIISDSSGCGLTDTDYVFVQVRPPLEVQVPAVVKFCVLRNAVIEAKGVGGDSTNYHFKWWWDGDANKTILSDSHVLAISPFSTRRYWVKITDSCSSLSDSALVTVRPESGVSLTEIQDTTLCYGQSVTMDVSSVACDSSAIVYYWNNGLGTGMSKTLSPLQSTDYQVVARDTVDGRTDTVNFRVNVLPALDILLGNDTLLCKGQNMTITPSVTGGNSEYRYRWMMDTGTGYQYMDTIASISLIADKNISYRLHVSDQCSAPSDSDEIQIRVGDELQLDITEDTLVCQGENVMLWSQTKGGDDSKHFVSWYDEQLALIDTGKTLPRKLNSSKGFIAVLMDNCTINPDTAFVFVDVRDGLSIAPISDIALCYGAETTINPVLSGGLLSSYTTYLQKEGAGFIEITTPYSIKPDTSSIFTLVLKDGCSEDSATVSFQIDVSDPLEAAIGVADSVCAGEPLNLKALLTGGLPASYDIDWYKNDTLLNMNTDEWFDFPQTTTKYLLVVGDGCSDKAYDSVQVVVLPEPRANFLISDTVGCSPLSITLSDNSLYHDAMRNVWKVAGQFYESKNAEITLVKPGSYDISLSVYNELNCTDKLTQQRRVLVYPKPVALFDVYPSARQTDEELLLIRKGTGAGTYYWDIGDGKFIYTNQDTLHYTYTDSGYFTITHIAVSK
ncbi:MAG: PKD domain-containing protein, partial [Bacteroidia bacterium]